MSKKKRNISKRAVAEEKKAGGRKTIPGRSFFRRHWRALVTIAVLSGGLYLQTVKFDYTLDDLMVITGNRFTQSGMDGIKDIFRYESFRGYLGEKMDLLEGDRYRPLSIASFAVEKSWGADKAVSHFINVLLYVLTGLLLFRIVLMMFPASGEGNRKWFFTVPFIAALLFVAHPLHTEVVANIKGRDEILALLGELGSLYFSFQYILSNKKRWLFFSFIAFLAGILSKEGAITFLAIVPLTLYFFTKATRGQILRATLPVFAGTVVYLLMRMNAIGYLMGNQEVTNLMNNPFFGMAAGERTATIFYTLLLYLKLLLVPFPLTHDYYPYHIPIMHWSGWQPVLSLLIYAGLIIVIIRGWKKKSVWAYAAAFYLAALSIVSNFVVSVGVFMSERFVYHASIGFCIAMGWLLGKVMQKNKMLQGAAYLVFLAMITFFSYRTWVRLPDWKDNLALDRSALKYSPNSARANCYYGIAIWQNVYLKLPANTDSARKIAVLDSMQPYFERSIQILPGYTAAQTMRAGMAAEYHKLNRNYDDLIRVYEQINRSGVNEKFVLEYLKYANMMAGKSDAQKLLDFYARMESFYSQKPEMASLKAEYQKLRSELNTRIPWLNQ